MDAERVVDGGAGECAEEDTRRTADLLLHGEIRLLGQLADSSNETFLIEVDDGATEAWAIYKPELGEAPLRDFEPGLYRRERAAFLLSEALGWHLVPVTVIREDAPLGIGSLQRFVDHDRTAHYFTLVDDAPETHDDLRRIAVFDAVSNNTDRKSGHVLRGVDGRIWGIDHGLCFSARPKLRTVVWDFAGERIADDLLTDLRGLLREVPHGVAELLTEGEVAALRRRALRLVVEGRLPEDLTGMAFPWPLV